MIRDMYALEDRHAAAHPYVVTDDDVLIVIGELVLIGKLHHGAIENVGAVIASDHRQVGAAHDVVAGVESRSGGVQGCSGAQVHVVSHVDISRSGDLAAAAECHVLAACSKGTP